MLLLCVLSAAAGFVLWLIIKHWALSSVEWMICFIGYPAVTACIGVILYAFNHEFH